VERTSSAQQQDAAAARLLRFWVLLGLLQLLAALGAPYAVELRAALVVLGTLRGKDGGPVIERCFDLVARPVMSRHVPRAARFLLAYLHAVVDALAPLLRSLLALAAFVCTPFARTDSLLELEAGLAQASADLEVERGARRRIEAAAALNSGAPGAAAASVVAAAAAAAAASEDDDDAFSRVAGATDFLDDAEVAARAASAAPPAMRSRNG
jgi:hypothetical protein